MTVSLVVVSHSEKIADGAAELAAQMAPDVRIVAAGGTTDGRIGTSLEKVLAAFDSLPEGAVILTDLGSAVMTAESALEFAENPETLLLADAPLVEGLVAAAVAAQGGADLQGVKQAAEAVGRAAHAVDLPAEQLVNAGSVTGKGPDFIGEFELINEAGLHARPAAKIAGGVSALDAKVELNGVDAASMTSLMTLGAGKGQALHVEAWGVDAERAVNYIGGLVQAGFGET